MPSQGASSIRSAARHVIAEARRPQRALAMAYDMQTAALGPAGQDSPWSIYGNVEYAHGSRDRQPFAAGYAYDTVGGIKLAF